MTSFESVLSPTERVPDGEEVDGPRLKFGQRSKGVRSLKVFLVRRERERTHRRP